MYNSGFTAGVVRSVWKRPVSQRHWYTLVHDDEKFQPEPHDRTWPTRGHADDDLCRVLYPSVDLSSLDLLPKEPSDHPFFGTFKDRKTLLSINRFERKKNLSLALWIVHRLKSRNAQYRCVLAGGYDHLNQENVQHYEELVALCDKLQLKVGNLNDVLENRQPADDSVDVWFLRSFSQSQKRLLLHHSHALLYTPHNEHFGIVPIEAMYCGCPPFCVASGGPLESVLHERTGFLIQCQDEVASTISASLSQVLGQQQEQQKAQDLDHLQTRAAEKFADAIEKMMAKQRVQLVPLAKERVRNRFHLDRFAEKLETLLRKTRSYKERR